MECFQVPLESPSDTKAISKLKASRTIRIIVVNFLIGMSGVIVLEAIFGNWLVPNNLNRLNLIRDTFVYDASSLYHSTKRIVYKRDRYGLRGEYDTTSTIDILTLGGSTTDQRYVSEGETWQDILSESFRRAEDSVRVVNAGVDGQSTYGHIKNFEWWFPDIPGLQVRYFLFYLGVNDFARLYASGSGIRADDLAEEFSPLKALVKERSALYYLFRTIRGIYRAQSVHQLGHARIDSKSYKWTDVPLLTDHEEHLREALLRYEERVRILGEKVRSFDAVPIFVTQVSRRYKVSGGRVLGIKNTLRIRDKEINGVDAYFMMQLINAKTLEACHDLGGICINLANELEFEDDDFYDFHHTTPKGSRKIGTYLYTKLRGSF